MTFLAPRTGVRRLRVESRKCASIARCSTSMSSGRTTAAALSGSPSGGEASRVPLIEASSDLQLQLRCTNIAIDSVLFGTEAKVRESGCNGAETDEGSELVRTVRLVRGGRRKLMKNAPACRFHRPPVLVLRASRELKSLPAVMSIRTERQSQEAGAACGATNPDISPSETFESLALCVSRSADITNVGNHPFA